MSSWLNRILATALVSCLVSQVVRSDQISELDLPTGSLKLTVAMVGKDLSVRPVPKWTFVLIGDSLPEGGMRFSTGFDGSSTQSLQPGSYRLTTPSAVEFEGKAYSWSIEFPIHAGSTTVLELAQDNATITAPERSRRGAELSLEGALYQQLKNGVFLVETETGHGSGFLVDQRGLVLTNSHVVHGSKYLAIQTTGHDKYAAALVAENVTEDLAVLRVHEATVADLPPLPLASDPVDSPPVAVGDRVLAIGSPLGTETILTSGLVSKIEAGAIHSDIRIDHGSSGGPLLDMTGQVIGLTSFGQGEISGIIRIRVAQPILEQAIAQLSVEPPSPAQLPVVPDFRFPASAIRQMALTLKFRPADYHVEDAQIDLQFITPAVIAYQEIAAEREAAEFSSKRRKQSGSSEYKAGEDFYEWRRYTGDYRPVVTIQAVPELGLTGGSIALAILAGLGGGGPPPMQLKFKTDFQRMELWRDGALVQPIVPGRIPSVQNMNTGSVRVTDVTYFGAYQYPPEAFAPGGVLELRVWEEGRKEPRTRKIPPDLIARIGHEFRLYFDQASRLLKNGARKVVFSPRELPGG